MDWLDDTRQKLRRHNQILFSRENPLLEELFSLLARQDRRTVTLWAFSLAEETVQELRERHPGWPCAQEALRAARLWAAGALKMPAAQKAILQCHGAAKEAPPEEAALFHAVGQACSVVHTVRHAPGYPIYELTALVRRYGPEACRGPVEARAAQYAERLLFWREKMPELSLPWASFLCPQPK